MSVDPQDPNRGFGSINHELLKKNYARFLALIGKPEAEAREGIRRILAGEPDPPEQQAPPDPMPAKEQLFLAYAKGGEAALVELVKQSSEPPADSPDND